MIETGVPGVDPQVELTTKKEKAFRTFTCTADQPNAYSVFDAQFTEITGNWFGNLSYDGNGFPVYNVMWQDPYDDYTEYPRVIQTFKEFTEVQSPSPATAAPWARYKVLSDSGKVPFSYIERWNTTGGLAPKDCGGKDTVKVEYKAIYRFYACRSADAGQPSPMPVPTPIVKPSPVVAPTLAPSSIAPIPVTPSPSPAAPIASPVTSPNPASPISPPAPVPVPKTPPPSPPAPAVTLASAAAVPALSAAATLLACLLAFAL